MESVLRKAGVHRNGKSIQLLAYANEIDIIARTMRDVTVGFSATERVYAKMGLPINEGKTKYMLSTSGDVPKITANSYNFDVVKEFIYLCAAINTNNAVLAADGSKYRDGPTTSSSGQSLLQLGLSATTTTTTSAWKSSAE